MVNLSILISSSEVSGPGGLFDFNLTLPLVAIQFILLMLILNTILYSPLLTVIEERKEYILGNLAKASEILAQANELTTQYEQELSNVRKETQLEITNSQKIHKEILEIELNISQKYIDNLGEDKEQTKDDLEDLLETIKDEAEAIAEASAEMADLLDDLLDKTEGEGDLPEDDSDEIQDANDDAEDADAEAAKESVEDPRIEAALKKADYPKGTFSEQCYLLSRIFSLVNYKHQQLDVDKWTATGMSKPLPYLRSWSF